MFRHPVFFSGLFPKLFLRILVIAISSVLSVPLWQVARAQEFESELNIGSKATLTIKNRQGRGSVIASATEDEKSLLQATSPGAPVEPGDVNISGGEITVRERGAQDRIDLKL